MPIIFIKQFYRLYSLYSNIQNLLPKNDDPNISSSIRETPFQEFPWCSTFHKLYNRTYILWRAILYMHMNVIFGNNSFQYLKTSSASQICIKILLHLIFISPFKTGYLYLVTQTIWAVKFDTECPFILWKSIKQWYHF